MRKLLIIIAIIFWLISVGELKAYDSSEGSQIDSLLSKVEFQDDSSVQNILSGQDILNKGGNANAVLFAWNNQTRSAFLEKLRTVLARMPLDVASIPRDFVRQIVVSNSKMVVDDDVIALWNKGSEHDRAVAALTAVFDGQSATGWSDDDRRLLRLAGEDLNDRIKRPQGESDYFYAMIFHEFIHVWQQSHPDKASEFYKIRYETRAKTWEAEDDRLDERYSKPGVNTLVNFISNGTAWQDLFEEDQKHPIGQRRWKDAKAFDKWYESVKANLQKRTDRGIDLYLKQKRAAYRRFRLPSRYGAGTRRRLKSIPIEELDTHAMQSNKEYMAILGEILWADPNLAKQYSPEEIAWIKHFLFDDRPIAPWSDRAVHVRRLKLRLPPAASDALP